MSETIFPIIEYIFDRSTLALIRRGLGRYGRTAGFNDRILSNLVLAVNEVTTNAVQHGGGNGHLRLWREGDTLWCMVRDQGKGAAAEDFLRTGNPGPGHLGGHGLWLTRQICDEVEIHTSRHSGTCVTLRYELPAKLR